MKALQKKISEKFYFVLDEKIALILNSKLIDISKLGDGELEIAESAVLGVSPKSNFSRQGIGKYMFNVLRSNPS